MNPVYVKKADLEKKPERGAMEYMEEMKKDKDVRIVQAQIPFAPEYWINDLSINQRGTDEDKAYAFNASLRTNIRRGNSVIYKETGAGKTYFYGRKGLQKFFDLQREYLEFNLGEIGELSKFGIKNGAEHKELERVIFKGAEESLRNGEAVTIMKLVKANGENAQVSYFRELDGWIVSSKNVALLARKKEDLELYPADKERFGFAKLIALVWFDMLAKLTPERVSELKKELDNRTIVGEYCGNQNYQHLVKYEQVDILFYALVDHNSQDSCLPPQQAYELFSKYGLATVGLTNEGTCKTFKELNEKLKKVFDDVAASDIEGEQEGSVLYFVREYTEGAQIKQQVLSLSKLKTLEYRIFRKLREKLKNFISRKDDRLRSKFETETKELCLNNDPAKPLEYYYEIGRLAFDFAQAHPAEASIITEQYISFLSVIVYCLESKITPQPSHFQKDSLNKLLSVSWSTYSSAQVKFGKTDSSSIKTTATATMSAPQSYERTLYVIIPVSVPGMGKSTFVQQFEKIIKENGADLFTVSSDNIRRNLMNSLKKSKPFLNEKQIFEQTQKTAGKQFFTTLQDCIQRAPENSAAKNIFVFIDKNHPPNALEKTVDLAIQNRPKNFNLQVCALLPSGTAPKKYITAASGDGFPFSMNFFLNCITRVQNRVDHPTLPGDGAKSLDVMIMFTNLFRNVSLSDDSLYDSGIDLVLHFPFIKETEGKTFPPEIVQRFEEAIIQTVPGSTCKDHALIQSLSDKLKNAKLVFENSSPEEIKLGAQDVFQQCITSITKGGLKKAETTQASSTNMDIEEAKYEEPMEEEKPQETANLSVKKSSTKRIAPQKFNPGRKPIFLGIFADSDDQVKSNQPAYVKQNLQALFDKFHEPIIQNNYNGLLKTAFKYPATHHITTFFVKKLDEIFFTNFEEGLSIPIEVLAMAYVPDKIICGVCLPDPNMIDIENKIPHMTLFVQDWAPRFSNNLLQALFTDKGAPLVGEFKSGALLNPEKSIIGRYSLPVSETDGLSDVYFIKPANKILRFEGTTRAFFGNNVPQKAPYKKR